MTAIALATVIPALAVGCSRPRELPPADELLRAASDRMRELRSVRFSLSVDGGLGSLAIRRAEGVLTREEGQGSIFLESPSGSLLEYQVVIAGHRYFVKGPTGGFQPVPGGLADRLYDPTRFLDPEMGLARVLSTAGEGRTEAAEAVGGRDAYRIRANVGTDLLRPLMPLAAGQEEVLAALWIGEESGNLLRVRMDFAPAEAEVPTTVTLTLFDFNAPATIRPPRP